MVDGDELHLEGADLLDVSLGDNARIRLDSMFGELRLDEGDRQAASDQQDVGTKLEQVRHRPDVVLMSVCEDDGLDVFDPVAQIVDVGQDEIDARLPLFGKKDAAVDDDDFASVFEDVAIAADLAKPSQGDDANGVGRQIRWGSKIAHTYIVARMAGATIDDPRWRALQSGPTKRPNRPARTRPT